MGSDMNRSGSISEAGSGTVEDGIDPQDIDETNNYNDVLVKSQSILVRTMMDIIALNMMENTKKIIEYIYEYVYIYIYILCM